MSLRPSQLETLRAVEQLSSAATIERISRHLGLERVSGEARLLKLRKAGLVKRVIFGHSGPVYRLTPAGEEELRRAG